VAPPKIRVHNYSPWRNRFGRIAIYVFSVTKGGREALREIRRLEKAQNARNKGDKTAMERLWKEDLTRAEASGDPLATAEALSHLGSELTNQGQYDEAEKVLRQAQEIARRVEGPAGFWSLGASNSLGLMCAKQGRIGDAESHLLDALHTVEKELGPDHHRAAFELLGLANFYHQHGRRTDEIAALERMIAIDEKQGVDPQNADAFEYTISLSLDRLAALYANEARDAEAEALYRRLIDHFAQSKKSQPRTRW